jgi:LacI family transcriptional regulator
MATKKDVATRAGVSHTTVSHVLNETRPVRASTRERVLAAARDLQYVPNQVARSLKQRVSRTIGFIVPNVFDPYFAELARGVEDACYLAGRSAIVCSTEACYRPGRTEPACSADGPPAPQRAYLSFLREKCIDALIVASPTDDPGWLRALKEMPCPLVITDRDAPGIDADLVQLDNAQAGQLAAEHLVALGHRAVGLITGPASVDVTRDRSSGFRKVLEEAGIELPTARVREADFTSAGGHRAARELLLTQPEITALFAQNDMMAVGVLRAAGELGIAVPGRLSVVGCDDVELSRFIFPSLSTVGASIRELGERAVETTLARITDPAARRRRVALSPGLRVRESTGPRAP